MQLDPTCPLWLGSFHLSLPHRGKTLKYYLHLIPNQTSIESIKKRGHLFMILHHSPEGARKRAVGLMGVL